MEPHRVMTEMTEIDHLAAEIGAGIWFFLAIFLFIWFLRYALVTFSSGVSAREDPTALAAITLAIFCVGSSMRAFLNWGQYMAENNNWSPEPWTETWPWFLLSVLFNIVGAAGTFWVLAPTRWRIGSTLLLIPLALIIPTVVAWTL